MSRNEPHAGHWIAGSLLATVFGFGGGMLANHLGVGDQRVLAESGPVRNLGDRPATTGATHPEVLGESIVSMVERVGPAVVSIDTLSEPEAGRFNPFFEQPRARQGQGSGFILDGERRLVITNNHVVESAKRIRVTLPDDRTFNATVTGTDRIGDVALLRLDGDGQLPALRLADSERLRIGQVTVAIGNPLGLENTVTQGVLSAIGRQLPEGRVRGIPLDDLLQTDAAINPGNSGGPLLDGYGNVIGMNTAIIPFGQGLGFAVSANAIRRSVEDLQKHGRVIRPWVGMSMTKLTPDTAQLLNVRGDHSEGVAILGVQPAMPAARAHLRRGDVVTRANGKPVPDPDALRQIVRDLNPQDRLNLKGFRAGKRQTWQITVGEMPAVGSEDQP